jgi:hypothetical protein
VLLGEPKTVFAHPKASCYFPRAPVTKRADGQNSRTIAAACLLKNPEFLTNIDYGRPFGYGMSANVRFRPEYVQILR